MSDVMPSTAHHAAGLRVKAKCKKRIKCYTFVAKMLFGQNKLVTFAASNLKKSDNMQQFRTNLGVIVNPEGLTVDIDRANMALTMQAWRLRNNLTQEQAGELLGCSRFQIIRVEHSHPLSWKTAYKLFVRMQEQLDAERIRSEKRLEELRRQA